MATDDTLTRRLAGLIARLGSVSSPVHPESGQSRPSLSSTEKRPTIKRHGRGRQPASSADAETKRGES